MIFFSLAYFSNIANNMFWSPPGDCAAYGTIVSLFIYNHKMPETWYPIANLPFTWWKYIMYTFHILCANYTLLFNVYPGQMMLLLASYIAAIIPLSLYSLVFIKTGSFLYSFIAFLFAYYLPYGKIKVALPRFISTFGKITGINILRKEKNASNFLMKTRI